MIEEIDGLVTKNKISTTIIVEKERDSALTEIFIRFDFDINLSISGVDFKNLKFFRTQKLTAEEVAQLILADAKFKLGFLIPEKND
jgi:hypothetical protein